MFGVRHALYLFLLLAAATRAQEPPIYAELAASRPEPFAGETIELRLTLFTVDDSLDREVRVSGFPDALTRTPFALHEGRPLTRGGRTWQTRFYTCRARPSAAGALQLAPTLDGRVVRVQRTFFFNQRFAQAVSIPLRVPLTLAVRPLPAQGRPADFSGAVGRFTLRASVEPRDVAVGDLVVLRVAIEGDGALDAAAAPRTDHADGFRAYPVQAEPTAEILPLRRVFTQTWVPLAADAAAVPACRWCYFDPIRETYAAQTAGPFPLTFHAEREPAREVYHPPTNPQPAAASHGAGASTTSPGRPDGWDGRYRPRVVPPTLSARFAPTDTAAMTLALRAGDAVRVLEEHEGWLRVETPDGTGWVPSAAIRRP